MQFFYILQSLRFSQHVKKLNNLRIFHCKNIGLHSTHTVYVILAYTDLYYVSTPGSRFACVTYGWTGSSPEVKYKGSRDGATDAYNKCGAYTAIIVDRHSREVLAEKSSPAGGRADIDKLERYASSNL